MNYFPFHIGDWCAATSHLDDLEELYLFRMLRRYYRDEAPLPADVAEVARLAGARDHVAVVQLLLNEFFTLASDGWHQARADREIAAYRAAAERGRAGARARWEQADLLEEGELSTDAPGNANQQPRAKNQKSAAAGAVNKSKRAKATPTPTPATAEAARAVCELLSAMGLNDTKADDPLLHELLQAGVPATEFTECALRSGHATHPFRYTLMAVKGRVEDQGAPAEAGQLTLPILYKHTVTYTGSADEATQQYLRAQELTPEQRTATVETARRLRRDVIPQMKRALCHG